MCIVAAAPAVVGGSTVSTPSAPIPRRRSQSRRARSGSIRGPSTTMKSFPSPWYFTKKSGTRRIIYAAPLAHEPRARAAARLPARLPPRRRRARRRRGAHGGGRQGRRGGRARRRRRDRAAAAAGDPPRPRLRPRARVPAGDPRAHRAARGGPRGLLELARRDVRGGEPARPRRPRGGRPDGVPRARARGRHRPWASSTTSHRDAAGRPYAEPAELALRRRAGRPRRGAARRAPARRLRPLRTRPAARSAPAPLRRALPGRVPRRPRRARRRARRRPARDGRRRAAQRPRLPRALARGARGGGAPRRLPLHVHAAEQPAEVAACRAEHGVTPVALLARAGALHRGRDARPRDSPRRR